MIRPEGLQDKIEKEVVDLYPGSRFFVRPSGTEDIVRICVETVKKEETDEMTKKITEIIMNNKIIN